MKVGEISQLGSITTRNGIEIAANSNGENLNITLGNGDGNGAGGQITLTTGNGSGFGQGGNILLFTGTGVESGTINIETGESTTGDVGSINVRGGNSTNSNGGSISLLGGNGGTGGDPGSIYLVSGDAVAVNGNGGNIILTPGVNNGTGIYGNIQLKGTLQSVELRFFDVSGEYVGFKSSNTLASSTIWTLPNLDGTNNQVLTTNGSGQLTFSTITPENISKNITQTAHGFSVGNVLRLNGASYALAQADTDINVEVIGIVSEIINVNTFKLVYSGYVDLTSSSYTFTAGSVYFLSATVTGELTGTEPSTIGEFSKPLLVANDTKTGYFFNFRGMQILSGTSIDNYTLTFSNGDLTSNILTVTHNLGKKFVNVSIYDDTDKLIIPDEVLLTNTTTLTVDFSSYAPITGNYTIVVIG